MGLGKGVEVYVQRSDWVRRGGGGGGELDHVGWKVFKNGKSEGV